MKTESSTCWYPITPKTAFKTSLTTSNASIQKDEMSALTAPATDKDILFMNEITKFLSPLLQ